MKYPTRIIASLASAALASFFFGIGPAAAVEGTTSWSVSAGSGWAYGSLTASDSKNFWSISGTLRDNRSGDNCTRGIVYEVNTWNEKRVVRDVTVCNGGTASMSGSGIIWRSWSPDTKAVRVDVCEKRSTSYACSSRSMLVQ